MHLFFLHRLCRLPGVALTCLAIALATRNRDIRKLDLALEVLRDWLCVPAPIVDFDALALTDLRVKRNIPFIHTRIYTHAAAGGGSALLTPRTDSPTKPPEAEVRY